MSSPRDSPNRSLETPLRDRLRVLDRTLARVVEDAVAVVAGDDLLAASHVRHHLRAQRHEAGGARAVARLRHRDAIPDALADTLVHRAHLFGKLRENPLALAFA